MVHINCSTGNGNINFVLNKFVVYFMLTADCMTMFVKVLSL